MRTTRATSRIVRGTPAVLVCLLAAALSGCAWLGRRTPEVQPGPEWQPRSIVRLTTKELWKEHDGGDQIYIHNGCLLETIRGYRHQTQPWSLRVSTFQFKTAAGAEAIFDYYYEGIENEVKGVEQVGDATYMWRSDAMRTWVVGFRKGSRFVEVSVSEEGDASRPMTPEARRTAMDVAGRVGARP